MGRADGKVLSLGLFEGVVEGLKLMLGEIDGNDEGRNEGPTLTLGDILGDRDGPDEG